MNTNDADKSGTQELFFLQNISGRNNATIVVPSGAFSIVIYMITRTTVAATSEGMNWTINDDTTAGNYRIVQHQAYATTTNNVGGNSSTRQWTETLGASAPSGSFDFTRYEFPFYDNPMAEKHGNGYEEQRRDTSSIYTVLRHIATKWLNTSPIRKISVQPAGASSVFVSGSQIRAYLNY